MFLAATLAFFTGTLRIVSFGVIAENVTLQIRRLLYQSIIRKHVGWFDEKDNAPGVITSSMASDA